MKTVFLSALLLLLISGCGGEARHGHVVAGKVVLKGGDGNLRALVGGKVRLQSVADSKVTAVGAIEDDGAFSLGTFKEEKGLAGVPAGEYKVRIELRPADDDTARRAVVDPKYFDFDKSGLKITVPTSGPLTIELQRSKK